MSKNESLTERRERIFNRINSLLVESPVGAEIKTVLEYLCGEFDLDLALVFGIKDMPFMLELVDWYESSPVIAKRSTPLVLDYRENSDWSVLNPFGGDAIVAVSDVSLRELDPVTKGLVEETGARAFLGSTIIKNGDYIGVAAFASMKGAREWTEEERGILGEMGAYLYKYVFLYRRELINQFLTSESAKIVQLAQSTRNAFVSNLSREIRTPVNALTGIVTILHHNTENADIISQCLDRMDKISRQLLDLLNSCLNDSMKVGDYDVLEKTKFMSNELLDIAGRAVEPLTRLRKQHIEFENSEPAPLFADKTKLSIILLTLASNACRYASEGGSVSVSVRVGDSLGNKVLIMTVKDDGEGMPEEIAENLLDRLEDINNPGRNTLSGLCLLLVKHYVELMCGSIEMFSEEGTGSGVTISIPVENPGHKTKDEQQIVIREEDTAELYIGRRILIAEDNMLMAEILATILGYRGLETDIAANGAEAVQLFSEHERFYYDMIFMDIQMPVMNGIEAARAIRSSGHADAGLIPIIALSADGFEGDTKKSLEAGMNEHLTKPVEEKLLFETIANYLI